MAEMPTHKATDRKAARPGTGLQPVRRLKLWRRRLARNPMAAPALWLAAAIIVIDQITKQLILHVSGIAGPLCSPQNPRMCGRIEISPFFDLTMVWNKGVSFGLLAGGMVSRIGLSVLSIGAALGLLYWLASQRRFFAAIAIGLIIGGALGNAYDRIVYGAVVDFLDFSGLFFPWVFNVADAAINIGFVCLLYDAFFAQPARPPGSRPPPPRG